LGGGERKRLAGKNRRFRFAGRVLGLKYGFTLTKKNKPGGGKKGARKGIEPTG